MDWFSPENIVAVVVALFGLLPPVVGAFYRRRTPRRKRIGYRVQMDTAIGGDSGSGETEDDDGRSEALFADMSEATLVLLRIENVGADSIAPGDYSNPDPHHGLSVVFTGRTVQNVEVIPDPKAEQMRRHFVPVEGKGGLRYDGHAIHLPRVPLNQDRHFKLLVLLSGGGEGNKVDVTGDIQDGEVRHTRSMTVDDIPPLFSRFSLATTLVLAVSTLVLAGLVVLRHPPPIGCATGDLRITGSTAFAPVLDELAARYEMDCPGSDLTVDARGSNEGLREVADAGNDAANGSPVLIALSDGPKPDSFTRLHENRVAVSAFALVVNDRVRISDLTLDQIRRIYRGDILNWSELDGPDLPILLVSRNANSGTRDLFRRHILGGAGEPAFTSRDCVSKNSPDDGVIRCELESTDQVLKTVARLPGAVGYSELRAATRSEGLHTMRIGGQAPSLETIGDDAYPFAEIEYAYTNGRPATGSLADSFLTYMIRGGGQSVMETHGHLPCFTPEGLERCQAREP